MDKVTTRGIIYATISAVGLAYEILRIHPPRIFLLVMYSVVFGIGMIYIFVLHEEANK